MTSSPGLKQALSAAPLPTDTHSLINPRHLELIRILHCLLIHLVLDLSLGMLSEKFTYIAQSLLEE